jgi:REP element-mobilizing transposase RayT
MRLQGYDYTQAGGYFVTIFTQGWAHLFGLVKDGEMFTNNLGRIVQRTWLGLPDLYAGIELGEYIVMPNHFHGILFINGIVMTKTNLVEAGLKPAPTNPKIHGLSELMRAFKTFSAREINIVNENPRSAVWQRGYFDRIIRDEKELDRIREYIHNNPDRFKINPADI